MLTVMKHGLLQWSISEAQGEISIVAPTLEAMLIMSGCWRDRRCNTYVLSIIDDSLVKIK